MRRYETYRNKGLRVAGGEKTWLASHSWCWYCRLTGHDLERGEKWQIINTHRRSLALRGFQSTEHFQEELVRVLWPVVHHSGAEFLGCQQRLYGDYGRLKI